MTQQDLSDTNTTAGEGIHRRQFFKTTCMKACDFSVLVLPGLGAGLNHHLDNTFHDEKEAYPCSDVELKSPQGLSFRNLGIFHFDPFVEAHTAVISARIQESDVVVFEKGVGSVANMDRSAFLEGKSVYEVDARDDLLILAYRIGDLSVRAYAGMKLIVNKVESPTRRNLIRALGYTFAFTGLFSPQDTLARLTGRPEFTYSSADLLTDGRSVKMVSDVETICQAHKDQKVLFISGDAHASGIRNYLSSDVGGVFLRLKEMTNAGLYKNIFGKQEIFKFNGTEYLKAALS